MYTESFIVKNLGLNAGDTLISPKSQFEIVQHYAIYLGQDYIGNHYLCENAYGAGVKLTRLTDFFKEYPKLTQIKRFEGNFADRNNIIKTALNRLGKPYDLINYNCEHFANDVIKNKPVSQQVKNALGVLGLALAVGYLVKN